MDDIVFCEVQPGNRFYAHKILKVEWCSWPPRPDTWNKKYTSGNNKGREMDGASVNIYTEGSSKYSVVRSDDCISPEQGARCGVDCFAARLHQPAGRFVMRSIYYSLFS